jgi:hypothetical protein
MIGAGAAFALRLDNLRWSGQWERSCHRGRQAVGVRSFRPCRVGRPDRGDEMIRKVLLLGIPLAGAGLIASQRQEITRYVKLRQMSSGTGHPENVPVSGSHAYPDPGHGAAEGTGDFDSASRGGPARAR